MKLKRSFSLDKDVVKLLTNEPNQSSFVNALLRREFRLDGQDSVEDLIKKAVAKEISRYQNQG